MHKSGHKKNNSVTLYQIDPTNLTASDSVLLGHLLARMQDQEVERVSVEEVLLATGEESDPYTVTLTEYGPFPIKIQLTHELIGRICQGDPTAYHYDAYSVSPLDRAKFSRGVYGDVKPILGTLTLFPDKHVDFHSHKARVGKIQNGSATGRKGQNALREVAMMSRMTALHPKPITFFQQGRDIKNVFVMRHLEGSDLEVFCRKDYQALCKGVNAVPTNTRIELCIAVAIALRALHIRNIVHRDVKPANVMVKLGPPVEAVMIDFGLSVDADTSLINQGCVGTPRYMSPEGYESGIITQESDTFSLGLVLAKIFRADDSPCKSIAEQAEYAKAYQFKGLFRGMADLSANEQEAIYRLLLKMVNVDPAKRCSLNEVIESLEWMLVARMYKSKWFHFKGGSPQSAAKVALSLRSQLDQLTATTGQNIAKAIPRLQAIVMKGCGKLHRSAESYQVFARHVRIAVCHQFETSKAFMFYVNQVTQEYLANYHALKEMMARMKEVIAYTKQDKLHSNERHALKQLLNTMQFQFAKNCRAITIEEIVEVSAAFKKTLLRNAPKISQLEEVLAEPSSSSYDTSLSGSQRLSY